MKVKTSITISSDLVSELNAVASGGSRSEFIEKAVWKYLELINRSVRDKRDMSIIETNSGQLNAEALDSLSFQVQL